MLFLADFSKVSARNQQGDSKGTERGQQENYSLILHLFLHLILHLILHFLVGACQRFIVFGLDFQVNEGVGALVLGLEEEGLGF